MIELDDLASYAIKLENRLCHVERELTYSEQDVAAKEISLAAQHSKIAQLTSEVLHLHEQLDRECQRNEIAETQYIASFGDLTQILQVANDKCYVLKMRLAAVDDEKADLEHQVHELTLKCGKTSSDGPLRTTQGRTDKPKPYCEQEISIPSNNSDDNSLDMQAGFEASLDSTCRHCSSSSSKSFVSRENVPNGTLEQQIQDFLAYDHLLALRRLEFENKLLKAHNTRLIKHLNQNNKSIRSVSCTSKMLQPAKTVTRRYSSTHLPLSTTSLLVGVSSNEKTCIRWFHHGLKFPLRPIDALLFLKYSSKTETLTRCDKCSLDDPLY